MPLAGEGVHKAFGGVHALRGADLRVRPGEVHALAGANGSGKSTLLGILSGQLQPDRGQVVLDGRAVRFGAPSDALAAGVGIVTQETTLVPTLSVAENVLLGHRATRRVTGIDWRATRRHAQRILERLGVAIDPAERVERLAPEQLQMVEIGRALALDTRVLILDEPTSSLTEDRVEGLFAVVRALRGEGVATIFVSHRTAEVLAIADRVTVLRDGRTVAAAPASEYDARRLLRDMLGEEPAPIKPSEPSTGRAHAVLEVRDLDAPPVSNVSLQVHEGEAVGLAGLVGAGRSELLDAVFGLSRRRGGSVLLDGAPLPAASPRATIRRGGAYLTADRQASGLFPELSVRDNLSLAATARARRSARRRQASEQRRASELVERLAIATPSTRTPAAALSGGNQQKLVLGRWLATSPRLLLLDEPTRGVDIAAKAQIHSLLAGAKRDAAAVLVSSSEIEELVELCDRVLVMARGRIVVELAANEASEGLVAHYAMGHHS